MQRRLLGFVVSLFLVAPTVVQAGEYYYGPGDSNYYNLKSNGKWVDGAEEPQVERPWVQNGSNLVLKGNSGDVLYVLEGAGNPNISGGHIHDGLGLVVGWWTRVELDLE